MREFENKKVRSRINRYSLPLIALIVVLIGGAGFAAAGGAQAVKTWFVTLELQGEDGKTYTAVLEALGEVDEGDYSTFEFTNEDGEPGTIVVQRIPDGQVRVTTEAAQLSAERLEIDAPGGEVELEGNGAVRFDAMLDRVGAEDRAGESAEMVVELEGINVAGNGANERLAAAMKRIGTKRQIVDEIPEPLDVFEWQDEFGVWREVYVVANAADDPIGAGFGIYSALDDGRYAKIGAIATPAAADMFLTDVVSDDAGNLTFTFEGAEGGTVSATVRPAASAEEFESRSQDRKFLRPMILERQ